MPDFNYVADNVLEEELNFDTLISQFENGFEQRRGRRGSTLRKFKLTFKTRTKSEMEGVKDFFKTKKGGRSFPLYSRRPSDARQKKLPVWGGGLPGFIYRECRAKKSAGTDNCPTICPASLSCL